MKHRIFIVLLLLGFNLIAIAQDKIASLAEDVVYYSDVVANAYLTSTKERAQERLVYTLEEFLSFPGSYEYEFDEVWISIKSPDDLSFKIYTWELQIAHENYDYFGYIQLPDGQYFPLSDQSDEMEDIEYMGLDKDFWYGALYYNIMETEGQDGQPAYVVFGINKKDQFTRNKVAEVISVKDGQIVFGSEIFQGEDSASDIKQRLHLSYSADANVTLNYNPGLQMIVYDNLIARMGMLQGQGPTKLPDGSYKGYEYKEGKWQYVDKIYHQISENVPNATESIPRQQKKDIMGRAKN